MELLQKMVSDMQNNLIWIRDEILPESEAKVNALSGMAQFGLNVFEGIRCYQADDHKISYAFRLHDHLDRLEESCKLIGFKMPVSKRILISNFNSIILKNNFTSDVAVRLTIFSDGSGSWHSTSPLSYFIAPVQKERTNISKLIGRSACISSWVRISDNVLPPRAKIGANYINGRFAHMAAISGGYDLPILLNHHGTVSEGPGSCIFMIKKNKLITPETSASILESITRDTILNYAPSLGLEVEEKPIDRTELYLADEVFMCGTAAEITPITSIDQYKIGRGVVGSSTSNLLKMYHKIVIGEISNYRHWLSKVE